MFGSWKERLKALGFKPLSSSAGRTVLVRPAGAREQSVILSRHGSEEGILVQLGIAMRDPYSEQAAKPLILDGKLDRAAGALTETLHGGTWWKPTEDETAWQLLMDQGIPWLERYGEPQALIAFYEQALREGIPEPEAKERSGGPNLLKRFFKGDGDLAERGPRRPPLYHLWLSLLYEEIGDLRQAAEHCLSYYQVVRSRPPGLSEEPGRTVRQLEAMGCAVPD